MEKIRNINKIVKMVEQPASVTCGEGVSIVGDSGRRPSPPTTAERGGNWWTTTTRPDSQRIGPPRSAVAELGMV
jgi:hypothetical protein